MYLRMTNVSMDKREQMCLWTWTRENREDKRAETSANRQERTIEKKRQGFSANRLERGRGLEKVPARTIDAKWNYCG
jgi:hypothetical protein